MGTKKHCDKDPTLEANKEQVDYLVGLVKETGEMARYALEGMACTGYKWEARIVIEENHGRVGILLFCPEWGQMIISMEGRTK